MAKRKDSVALFEVIKAQKKREERAAAAAESAQPGALRTPKWWFKRAPTQQQQQQAAPADPFAAPALPPPSSDVPVTPAPTAGPGEYSPDVDPTMSRTAAALVQRVIPVQHPERVSIPGGGDRFGVEPRPLNAAPASRTARSWFGFGPAKKIGIDPDRKEVTFRLRYTTAVIAGFALCVAVGLAYLSGRSSSRANAGANGVTSEDVRNGPVLAGVLELPADRSTISDDTPAGEVTAPSNTHITADPPAPQPEPPAPRGAGGTDAPPAAGGPRGAAPTNAPVTGGVVTDLPRHNGLNYVIIQSYPNKKDAEAAKEALLAAGINCTVQHPPKGWGSQDLWSVIGTSGFPRTNTMAEYRHYIELIKAVSKTFAGKSKWKHFEPSPVKWNNS
jgi:hypothetical protein